MNTKPTDEEIAAAVRDMEEALAATMLAMRRSFDDFSRQMVARVVFEHGDTSRTVH